MRAAASIVAILVLLASFPADGRAISRKKECKQACGAMIDACVASGGKRKKCKRQTLKQCRKGGVATCRLTPTTTVTIPTGTTLAPCESSSAPTCGGRCGSRAEVCSNQGGTCACVRVRL